MLERTSYRNRVTNALRRSRVVALVGPRQSGKTTLARSIAAQHSRAAYFDLENPEDLAALDEPLLVLKPMRGLVVIDEIQRKPGLFEVLRVLADRKPLPARVLVLGSASGDLLKQSSESLAGRIEYIELHGFDLTETGRDRLDRLWIRGGFPPSFLARTEADSVSWREQFIRTFLQRDIPELGIRIPSTTLERFWSMLAHYHGQTVNYSDLGRSLQTGDTTIRRYIEILNGTFMIRLLPPWHENLGKRLVKAPKIYFNDSGLFHSLQKIKNKADLVRHPKLGAS